MHSQSNTQLTNKTELDQRDEAKNVRAPVHGHGSMARDRTSYIDRARRSISTEARKANLVDSITSFSTLPKKYNIKFDFGSIKDDPTDEVESEKENRHAR